MGQLLPLTTLLLLVSASMQAADLPKAVVFLDPPWVRVLQEDNVTLKCQGAHPSGHNSTQWLHNGNLISSQASSYFIASARVEDSGEYRCQTGLSMLSDPVQLDVHTGWLLLQAPKRVFQEGETIRLRCHSWRNKAVHKVTYLQDGKGPAFPSTSPVFPPWHQIAFCLIMGLLFAVDTGLYFSVQRNLQRSVEDWTEHKFRWSQDPQDK
ncbi:low affinity immunoglobulin gamma Fc region receptor III-A-like isoform X4 [Sciurus carolinensis]|uniref:low affinity immunoglobulin gamma Fc region receptor III-A-like isoform X4 n=1 Tax=Sciurus carolinensis TaxID=30640 RepID=UPI001FB4A2F2|nr:low affinity immunoglobulin gamma Fc region receptor III-A-like isoform X4 [Sciurus carolinensis]